MTDAKSSLLKRISAMISSAPDLEPVMATFPAYIPECWEWTGNDAMLVYYQGKRKRVVRTLIEIGYDEPLSQAWIPVRLSTCRSKRCINPTHFDLKPHNQNRFGAEGPRPTRSTQNEEPSEVDDIHDLLEEWGYLNEDNFLKKCEECHLTFSPEAIAEVFRA